MCFPPGEIGQTAEEKLKESSPPPPAPDITSELLDATTRTEKAWARPKRGRRSTFLTGQTADSTMTPPPSTLLGG